jgi:hypothetical protein
MHTGDQEAVQEPGHGVLVQRQVRLAGEDRLDPAAVIVKQLSVLAALDQVGPSTAGQAREARPYPHGRPR